ncbi:MAG: LysM peptidoglycan-binding domain-containing protein [Gammaproteobacteria bacterium]|nr:LysM peptidoglycan-binding domain-containing protein [Gammaproteobacteria bacterium]MBU1722323.1 LysM peptidoglycan-binding domain-containing protein [Gammaproteobacteria bacterium]MBU2006440.1 LysM peptidoglycan-binding domain-containing protein [Gammaproteobacteria bacterium]
MDRKIKLVAAVSLVGLSAAACAPNPYWQYPGYTTNRSAVATTTTNNKASVTHSHNGKVHSHALPPEGLAHTHNMGVAGQAGTNYAYTQPQSNTYYTPPVNTATTYGYNTTTPSYNTGSYYDYSAPKSTTATSTGTYYDYGNTGTSTTTTTTTPRSNVISGDTYLVQQGDTVFQVMRNTGVYWKDVIRLNNLQAPDYTIKPGQRLRLN